MNRQDENEGASAGEGSCGPSDRERALREALDLLSGLHPCLTVDDDPMVMAEAIFAHVQAEKAEMARRIEQLQRSVLSGRDSERLADLLNNPPAPNEALKGAVQRYRQSSLKNCTSLESVIAQFEADPEMSKIMQQVRVELRRQQDVAFAKLLLVTEAAAAIDEVGADAGCRKRLAEMARAALRFMREGECENNHRG